MHRAFSEIRLRCNFADPPISKTFYGSLEERFLTKIVKNGQKHGFFRLLEELHGPQEPKDSHEPQDPQVTQEPKGPQDPQEPQEHQGPQEPHEPQEPQGPQDSQ